MVASLAQIYPEQGRALRQHLTDKRSLLAAARRMTTGCAAHSGWAHTDMDNYVNRPLDDILDLPEIQHVLKHIWLGASVPAAPVLLVQAVHDPLITIEDIDTLAETYMAFGATVVYHRDMLSDHILLRAMSAPMTLRWLSDRFAGRPLTDSFVSTTWRLLMSPTTYRDMARLALIAAKLISGRTVGRLQL
jgi:Secretory lipase